jgi:hypothetical protein
MPAKSKAQQRLMQAAEHGADFPMAQKVRSSMTHDQMHEFAVGRMTGKPAHVRTRVQVRYNGKPAKGRHPHANLGGYLHPPKR